jgi:hypothetical protein
MQCEIYWESFCPLSLHRVSLCQVLIRQLSVSVTIFILLSVIMLSVVLPSVIIPRTCFTKCWDLNWVSQLPFSSLCRRLFYQVSCLVLICLVSFCQVSLCLVSLCQVHLCQVFRCQLSILATNFILLSARGHFAKCHFVKCHFPECRGADASSELLIFLVVTFIATKPVWPDYAKFCHLATLGYFLRNRFSPKQAICCTLGLLEVF